MHRLLGENGTVEDRMRAMELVGIGGVGLEWSGRSRESGIGVELVWGWCGIGQLGGIGVDLVAEIALKKKVCRGEASALSIWTLGVQKLATEMPVCQ